MSENVTNAGVNSPAAQGAAYVHVAAGAELSSYLLNAHTGALDPCGSFCLPARVQYAWPHASLPILYVGCADRGGVADEKPFYLCALLRDDQGRFDMLGAPVTLPERPIHLTTDTASRHVLVAYGGKPGLTVYRTQENGAIGSEIPRSEHFDFGTKPHHVRMAPDDGCAVLVARGAKGFGKPAYVEGAFKIVRFDGGEVEITGSYAPEPDRAPRGFNPRNVDFHPTQPLMFATLEAQNELAVFAMEDGIILNNPLFTNTILAFPNDVQKRQDGGEVHVHPSGRYVYVANRNDGYVAEREGPSWLNPDPIPEFPGGENSIAVFELGAGGRPILIQHVDTQGLDARTIALDASGTVLVVADIAPMTVRQDGELVERPASVSVFGIGGDGRLTFLSRTPMHSGREKVLWMGVVG